VLLQDTLLTNQATKNRSAFNTCNSSLANVACTTNDQQISSSNMTDARFHNYSEVVIIWPWTELPYSDYFCMEKYVDTVKRVIIKTETGCRCPTLWPPSWKSIWRHNFAVSAPVCMKFGRHVLNHIEKKRQKRQLLLYLAYVKPQISQKMIFYRTTVIFWRRAGAA